ncbi:hypothetical protein AVXHC19_19840 [Acidovorax sacchari]
MTTALASHAAINPLPESRRFSAWFGVSVPETAGAVLPVTKPCGAMSWMRVCRAQPLSASASGWGGMLIGTGASGCAAPCAPTALAPNAKAMAKARGAGRKFWRLMKVLLVVNANASY